MAALGLPADLPQEDVMNVSLRSASVLLAATAAFAGACGNDHDLDNGVLDAGVPQPNTGFKATNLISNQAGVAPRVDASLVNAWGLAMDTQSFWIANNGSGKLLVVAPDGSPSRVSPPAPALNVGAPIDGIVFNTTGAFMIGPSGNRAPATMLVATENGQIFAINASVAATPQLVVNRSSVGAVYKGVTIFTGSDGTVRLAATDFHNARIDVFDGSFNLMSTIVMVDPSLRAGLAPFNIMTFGQNVYVTYAIQDAAKHDDVPGIGNGRIDVFNVDGLFVKTLVDGNVLNAPWGMALAPSNFGPASGLLVVGNFGDGTLVPIDPNSGRVTERLLMLDGTNLAIDGLWGLAFGNGQNVGASNVLYFAAGPNAEANGLFGRIDFVTAPTP
jgi:uncharacterized protein (TIGR03118 family)